MMRNKALLFGGILAAVFYVIAVILGGVLSPGYSHLSQYISELIQRGAPNKALLDPLFAIYNLLTIAFGIGVYLVIRNPSDTRRKTVGMVGAWVLVAEGLVGFLTVFFPQDPIGGAATATGTMHIVLAGLSSLTTMLAMLLLGLWFRALLSLKAYGTYSFISVLVVFLSGGLAASTIAHPGPWNGLIERITIGAFLQWMFVIAWRLTRSAASDLPSASHNP